MILANYHSHTHYCDGTDAPEVYVQAALNAGLQCYGFSTHSPVPFRNAWSISSARVIDYLADIRRLKEDYARDIELYLGMEADFIPGLTGPQAPDIAELKLDYTIGSIHFVDAFSDGAPWEIDGPHQRFEQGVHEIFGGDARKAVTRYFDLTRQMLTDSCPDVLGHMDKIKMHNRVKPWFDEGEEWYREEVFRTLKVLKRSGAILEVNTRGIYKKYTTETYPGRWVLQQAYAMEIPVMVNSDSHHPREILMGFDEAYELLYNIGYREVMVLTEGQWQPQALTINQPTV